MNRTTTKLHPDDYIVNPNSSCGNSYYAPYTIEEAIEDYPDCKEFEIYHEEFIPKMDALDVVEFCYRDDYLPCGLDIDEWFDSEAITELQTLLDWWVDKQKNTYFEIGSKGDSDKYYFDVEAWKNENSK